ncbi:MAG: DNA replication protein DnaC, partial [Oscillospiraceae bacterium]|nr:DNA replication protein DnaC [Oscillospiraceae bacterium]
DDILSVDLLVLDGLGNEVITNLTQGIIFEVIDTRITRGLPTIITTLFSEAEMQARYSPQLMSRLRGEYTELMLKGNDIRLLKKGQKI